MERITKTRQAQVKKDGTKTVWINDGKPEVEAINRNHYNNFVEAAPFFRRAGGSVSQERSYTSRGYNVTKDVTTKPDKTGRTITTFDFE